MELGVVYSLESILITKPEGPEWQPVRSFGEEFWAAGRGWLRGKLMARKGEREGTEKISQVGACMGPVGIAGVG